MLCITHTHTIRVVVLEWVGSIHLFQPAAAVSLAALKGPLLRVLSGQKISVLRAQKRKKRKRNICVDGGRNRKDIIYVLYIFFFSEIQSLLWQVNI